MSQEAVEKVLGRMLTDDDFRQRAALNMAVVCHLEGYLLSDAELRSVSRINIPGLTAVSEQLGAGIKRFSAKQCY